jgi:hypothetical protein
LRESKTLAATKERAQLAEKERLRKIEEHQQKLREEDEKKKAANRKVVIPETNGKRLMYGAIKGNK